MRLPVCSHHKNLLEAKRNYELSMTQFIHFFIRRIVSVDKTPVYYIIVYDAEKPGKVNEQVADSGMDSSMEVNVK